MPMMQKSEPDYVAISNMPADDAGLVLIQQTKIQLAYAQMLFETGAVSRARFQTPHQVFVGIQGLISLGLNPIMALRSCGFANGNFTIWGDLPMAVVRKSGKLKHVREFLYVLDTAQDRLVEQKFENNNLHKPVQGAVCELYRNDEETVTRVTFDIENAKQAGLWQSTPVWKKYPQIMLMRRARAAAINTLFGEVSNGVAQGEYDVVGVPESQKDMRLRHEMQTKALQALQQKMLTQKAQAADMDEVIVHEPFEGIASKDLRRMGTPEALAEFEKRKAAYEARMREKIEAEAPDASDEEQADYEREMGLNYDEAVKLFGGRPQERRPS